MIKTIDGEDFTEDLAGCYDEQDMVSIIKEELRTAEHRRLLAEADLSIEELLNGRYAERPGFVDAMFADWNEKLGFHWFGF